MTYKCKVKIYKDLMKLKFIHSDNTDTVVVLS